MTEKYGGLPASEGIALGPVWFYSPQNIEYQGKINCDPKEELGRFINAVNYAKIEIAKLVEIAALDFGDNEAEIFAAHMMILEDPELLGLVEEYLRSKRISAEEAVDLSITQFAEDLLALESDYFKERAQDVRDVGRRILSRLIGVDYDQAQMPSQQVIVVAEDLSPSDTIRFDREKVLGLCTVKGGPTSHTAILARSLGIPAVVSTQIRLEHLAAGQLALLNGTEGWIVLNPGDELVMWAKAEVRLAERQKENDLLTAEDPAVTKDGVRFEVAANIGNLADARQAVKNGAEGIGLFRTEFLYIDKEKRPSKKEQISFYQEIAEAIGVLPVVVRTLDVGGDKLVAYLDLPKEANPFLGWRGIRMSKEHPEWLEEQFETLLLGFSKSDLRIMLPMISQIDEIKQSKEMLKRVTKRLYDERGFEHPKVQLGMMVEVPSAAIMTDQFSKVVDFFSIGTNDLTQYVLAADRTNERVSYMASPYDPAVLRLINTTIVNAHANGRWVGLCGGMAGDPAAAPLLVGFGVDELSMAPGLIPRVKQVIRRLDSEECKSAAKDALNLQSAEEVREYLKEIFKV